MKKGFQMPLSLRKILANPIESGGMLAEGPPEKSIPETIPFLESLDVFKNSKLQFICVGDIVSKAFYNDPKLRDKVKYFIYDGKTQHDKVDFKYNFLDTHIIHKKFRNDPGLISYELFHFFKITCKNNIQYLVEIDGEEDLLVIPSVLFEIHENEPHFVFYGQPPITDSFLQLPSGMVTIWTINVVRKKVNSLFQQFTRS